MPKATVNKNDFSHAWKDQIWLARQVISVQSVSLAHGVNHAAHDHFGGCVAAFYRPHGAAALL